MPAPNMCPINCGFFGSPSTQNLGSKCYRDLQQKEQQALALSQTLMFTFVAAAVASHPSSYTSSSAFFPWSPFYVSSPRSEHVVEDEKKKEETATGSQANRCTACSRRMGLTGFKCWCGITFCGTHRYPDQHACGFDFRSMGREQIAKANPVTKGHKLQKI